MLVTFGVEKAGKPVFSFFDCRRQKRESGTNDFPDESAKTAEVRRTG